jgi:hypothetical protein
MSRKRFTTRWLSFYYFTLDGNSHGPEHTSRRSTCRIVRMDSYAKTWTLYVYRKDASVMAFQIAFPRWLGPWPSDRPEPIKYPKEGRS